MTEQFKQACKNPAYQNRLGKIEYGNNQVISYSDYLSELEWKSDILSNDMFIGSANADTIKITTLSNYDLGNEIVYPKIGIRYEDETEEYLNLGKYTILFPSDQTTKKTSELEGYNDLSKLNDPYVCQIEDFENATIGSFYEDVCDQLGLTPTSLTFLNHEISISGNPFLNGETTREVLQAIARVACSFIRLNPDTNEIALEWFDDTVIEEFTKEDYTSLEKNGVYGPINTVTITMSDIDGENVTEEDEESIASDGKHSISIVDDYFLTTPELRTQALSGIWSRLHNFSYVGIKLVSDTGKPYLKAGNKISIQDADDTFFTTYLLSHTFSYDGAFHSTLESSVILEEEVKLESSTSLKAKLSQTKVEVDKAKQTIGSLVTEINDQDVRLSQQEITLDGITTTVSNIQSSLDDYATTEEVTNIIEQTIESTTNIIQKTGGFNLLLNTQWYQDLAEWEVSAANDYSVDYESADVLQNTESKSELNINTATVKQTFQTMIGQTVTISFKYKKAGILTGGDSYVRLYRSDDDYVSVLEATEAQEDRKQVKLTYTSTVNTPTLVINSDRDDLWITDLAIQYGESDVWSPNATETRGQNYSLTLDGLYLKDIASGEEMYLTGNKLQFENGFYGNGEMQTEEGTFTQSLNVCGLTYTYIDDDNVIVN